jgi:hypothetical protein
MAHGSYFIILRYNNSINKDLAQKVIDDNKILKDEWNDKTIDINDVYDYFPVNIKTHEYINIKNGKTYSELLNVHFNSVFKSLIEEFNMNPYNKTSQIILNYNITSKMIQAINYILSNNYNKDFEKILDNYYLKVFEDLYPDFYNRFNNNFEEYYELKNENDEAISILNRVLHTLNTYKLMQDENDINKDEILLVYNNY